jgi:hypothetical protein
MDEQFYDESALQADLLNSLFYQLSAAKDQPSALEQYEELTHALDEEMAVLKALQQDYASAMDLIGRGYELDRQEVYQVHNLYDMTLDLIIAENQALRLLTETGLVIAVALIPFAGIAARADRLKALIELLESVLEQARQERNEAWRQAGINAALGLLHLFGPHWPFLVRAGLFAGQVALDFVMGPPKSAEAKAGATTVHAIGAFADASEKVLEIGQMQVRFRKTMAGPLVVGMLFDGAEILHGHRNYDKLKKLMARAKAEYEALVELFEKNSASVRTVRHAVQAWHVLRSTAEADVSSLRRDVSRALWRARYRGDKPKQWKILRQQSVAP